MGRVPYIDVLFQMAPKGKSCAPEVKEVSKRMNEELKAKIERDNALGKSNLLNRMHKCGLAATHSVAYVSGNVIDCSAYISLTVMHPKSATTHQAHCVYTGSHLTVTHKSVPSHDTFNCHHRFNRVQQVWECKCFTWNANNVAQSNPAWVPETHTSMDAEERAIGDR